MARRRKGTKKETTPLTDLQSDNRKPVITLDYERYAHFLEDEDLTEEQKHEFIETLWNIIVEFVSLGFGVHPLQQASTACGQLDQEHLSATINASDTLYLDRQFIEEYLKDVALSPTEADGQGVGT